MCNKLFSLVAMFTLALSLTAIAQDKGGKSVTLTGNILDVYRARS
jgi:hypothetical protein